MYHHQQLVHRGEQPKFIMKVVGSHRSALSRQISEAVRIRRRGGESMILNSKAEYNRCHIPRLRVELEEEREKREQELKELEKNLVEEQEEEHHGWEQGKTKLKDRERRKELVKDLSSKGAGSLKARRRKGMEDDQGNPESGRRKRRRYGLIEKDWGITPVEPPLPPREQTVQGSSTNNRAEEQPRGASTTPSPAATPVKEDWGCDKSGLVVTPNQIALFQPMGGGTGTDGRVETLTEGDITTTQENEYALSNVGVMEERCKVMVEDTHVVECHGTESGTDHHLSVENHSESHYGPKDTTMCEDTVTPSVVSKPDTMGNMNFKGATKTEITDDNADEVCVYKRGYCTYHKSKGVRMVTKTKKWGKMKTGFGWIYSSKVSYSCRVKSDNLQTTNFGSSGSESQSPGLADNNLGINITKGVDD